MTINGKMYCYIYLMSPSTIFKTPIVRSTIDIKEIIACPHMTNRQALLLDEDDAPLKSTHKRIKISLYIWANEPIAAKDNVKPRKYMTQEMV